MVLMMIPQGLNMLLPLVLAIIFSALMRKHKIIYHETMSARKQYASLLSSFSIMEGRLGYSPGKLLLGIRVFGTDLQLCGFWRALVRNLLMFVDGFFNFMVGIMVVALTEHWQRIGDMAARTVVVDTRER
jgi:hypothetical protein